ncbi:hypothetical protein DDD_2507 [Nonlabens dokdonensis DSW-6]|uniref:Uncharacterized protein n=1 Tax=Nonlabens dokdonensis (strain DSM 17205 / KCTC 12402 / DSW-6) TaxID=592029 RepID=L7WC06_NONDD|nr:hypothetical protein DDD_2507 [Nonlabens dokdonensis DSW-6]
MRFSLCDISFSIFIFEKRNLSELAQGESVTINKRSQHLI